MRLILPRWRSASPTNIADWATLLATTGLAIWTLSEVTHRAGGIALPLDDSYIHFCYARSFAQLTPFVYSPGAQASAGATSLLWPLILAPFQAILGTGLAMAWVAVILGFASLWGLCRETRLLAIRFTDETLAPWLGALPLCFAGHAWFAASGMEVMPLAWLLSHSCRKTIEYRGAPGETRHLLLLAALCPLMRPEGALLSIWIAVTLWKRSTNKALALVPIGCITLPALVIGLFTHQFTPTTAQAKWLPLNPYLGEHALELTLANLRLLFLTLFNGEGWTPMFLPTGHAALAALALVAVASCLLKPSTRFAACAVLIVAAGMLLPASYETFLVNRVRYIWPFITPWLIGLGIIAARLGDLVTRLSARAAPLTRHGVLGVFAIGLGSKLPDAIDDLAQSAHAINEQQVSLAHWARGALPKTALLGVNDAGALAYFSGLRTFDLVGLTTAGEATHWRAGAGSRFEHYERLEPKLLPSHFVVYPEWLQVDVLLGPLLQERFAQSTILGGPLMRVHQANYDFLHSGDQPSAAQLVRIVDEVDVADLESERAHGYVVLPSTAQDNQIFVSGPQADGGRSNRIREQFRSRFEGDCSLVLRLHSESALALTLQIGTIAQLSIKAPGDASWTEPTVRLPPEACSGEQAVSVTSDDGTPFSALHYWSTAH